MAVNKLNPSISGVPFGTSSDRPASPSIGQTFYNGTLGVQEIYTSSGWLPATGANDFNVTLTGSVTTSTFTKEYFAGAYTIASALLDSTYDIYVYDTVGNQVGYTKSPSLNATGNFNKIVIIGGTTGDLLSFSYKTTFTATSTTSQVTSGAFISSATPTALNSIDDTTTITGGNFASNVSVYFVGSDNTERAAKSIVRTSTSELIVTRPDDFPTTLGTYKLVVENPGVTRPTGSSLHILNNAVTAGTTPNWTTATTLPEIGKNIAYSTTLVATDTEGTDIDYSVVSGSLPIGITLNSETGVLSGTYTGSNFNTTNLIIRAIDTGGNIVDRTFTIFSSNPVWTTTSVTGFFPSTAYSFQLVATDNSSITYSIVSGTLPSGFSLSSSGLISGTTTSSSTTNITFRATDSVGNYSDATFSIGPSIVTSGLRVWYSSSSYSSSSNTITDLSGNGYNATKRSGITVGGSAGTQFLQFPSNSGGNHHQLIHIPENSILGSTSWSIEAWVNQSTSDNLQTIFHGGGGQENYHLAGWDNGNPPTVWMGNVGGFSISNASIVPSINTDNHVVWSLNGSNNTINFYVNGVLSGTASVSAGTITAQNTTDQNVYVIGQELDVNSVDINNYTQGDTKQEFTGKLYTFRLYNKALSGSEVSQNYSAGKHV